ncbi:hypothetical protein GCM10010203_60580 [Actinomadura yumaensis]|uniref:hypothetical protein n=1 Tax=Brevundimonas sp. TaxID=1871086 RepID=UPI001A216FC3|nr:hypothetical protein [Brevundimonas sp.]MBJ7512441.1 hypothetical protein [Brevundimonas sp.]
MAQVQNPTLFSVHFGLSPDVFALAGLIDPFIDVDTPLFIDPVLLEKSSNATISGPALAEFRKHFSNFIRLLTISVREGDAPWRAAQRLLDLSEPAENGLGFGGSGRSGSSRPDEVRDAIVRTAKEVVTLGSNDPEMISLMGFFEEGVGPDTISDFTTRVIIKQLAEVTAKFCEANGVALSESEMLPGYPLPSVKDNAGRARYLILVPKDIVRDLPIANDWSDIEAAINQSARIRDAVNVMLAGIARPTTTDRKDALKSIALQSPQNFQEFLAAVKEHVRTYDPNVDALGYYKMKSIFASGFEGLKSEFSYDVKKGPEEIKRIVIDTINFFKHHVENGNLWEELWLNEKPKKERAAQLIYFAIADAYCHANDIDISPEANMGGGPIDFKFSQGYQSRILVEMKRSSGTVRHGYERQLDFYLNASKSDFGIYVVIDFGDLNDKLDQITQIQTERRAAGQRASEIIVIDATKKLSASKRS